MWGARVIIPSRGRNAVLQQLHEGHQGMTRMKSLAHTFVWWPGLDSDINFEKSVQQCCHCQEQQSVPPVAPLQPWKWPSRLWVRLHMDFAGPIQGKMLLLTLGACASEGYSSWVCVCVCVCVCSGKISFYVRLRQSFVVATVYI